MLGCQQHSSGISWRSRVAQSGVERWHRVRSQLLDRGHKLMRALLLCLLMLSVACEQRPSMPAPAPRDLASAVPSDMAVVDMSEASPPDLARCAGFAQGCLGGVQCCKDESDPLLCVGGACTYCVAAVGADCSSRPCCEGLCVAGKCEPPPCVTCNPTTGGGACTPSRCAKTGEQYCCT